MKVQPVRSKLRPAESGFTLVEIMVVIVILGLLATMVATNVLVASDDAKIGKAQTDLKTIQGAAEMFYAKKGRPPDTVEELAEKDERGNSFLKELSDDPWGNAYVLRPGDRPREFEIISFGPDGSEGTEDDISSKTKKEQ